MTLLDEERPRSVELQGEMEGQMRVLILAAAMMCAGQATAQGEMPTLEAVTSEIVGREVTVVGQLFSDSSSFYLRTEGASYPVEFAVDRQTLQRIRSCEGMFRRTDDTSCTVTAAGEIWVDSGWISLTLFDVRFHD